MRAKLLLLITANLLCMVAYAQVKFFNRNDLLSSPGQRSAVPVAIADMNGDGFDDIVTMDNGTVLYVQYQTPDLSRPFVRYKVPVTIDVSSDPQNDICIADFNNDGANDIFITGSYDRTKVLYGIPHSYGFNFTYIVVDPYFSQGASAGDFNNDGWVDVVVLNDNGENYTMMNDGTGTLVEQPFFNFVTVPVSDNSGNYGSVYSDFDMDGDLDFYIAKCRQGVTNPSDPRRIDVLFVNDGNGNYTQKASQYGLADRYQTWTADFGDIDNDGDLDLFKTEHDVICALFENIDNDTFIDITPQSGINIGGTGLQGMIRDFDNDGWQDILVSGDLVEFWRNNGDHTFTRQQPFGNNIFGTYALGDLNHDGFTDIYASTVIPFNQPHPSNEDILYLGEDNGNHFLSIDLIQPVENTSAIGAMAILYSDLGIQIREVRAGEQYGVSNSHNMIFGMANLTTYDSLIIRWPDGTRESFNSLTVDEKWTLRRGGCARTSISIWPTLKALCNNESFELTLPEFNISSWSTGSTNDTLTVTEDGLYFATILDDVNCLIRTEPIEIITDPDSIKPTISYEGNKLLCNSEEVVLSLPFGLGYLWSSGEQTQNIVVTSSGDYFASVQGYCKNQISDTLHFDFVVPATPETVGDTFSLGEQAVVTATGDSIVWYSDPDGTNVIGYGSTYLLDGLTDDSTVYAQNLGPIPGQEYQLGPVTQQGNTKYNGAFINGGLQFEVFEPVLLKEFSVYTDSIGPRIIEITNGSGFFFDKQVELGSGKTVIPLDVNLPAGNYTVSTNGDLNVQVFGNTSPILWRSSDGVSYPYLIDGVVSISNSTFGTEFYYYFYDWKIETSDKYCGSDLAPVTAYWDFNTSAGNAIDDKAMVIMPNPTSGLTHVIIQSSSPITLEVTSMAGERIHSAKEKLVNGSITLDMTGYPSGIYFIRMIQDGKMYSRKMIKL
ncbi:MAG TPA: FG-GAP-like repeat-containing protein [Saprospiraceae bacterium]|nr:FG-GAP-like repeat-containing protein [Saprospiraceae bacterium]